jgi:hypothetical protein
MEARYSSDMSASHRSRQYPSCYWHENLKDSEFARLIALWAPNCIQQDIIFFYISLNKSIAYRDLIFILMKSTSFKVVGSSPDEVD